MLKLAHSVPAILGIAYAIVGTMLGLETGQRDWLELLAAVAALLTGLWTAAAARRAEHAGLRRSLLALSLLAPVTLLPASFQLVAELGSLKLLAAAGALDVLWCLSALREKQSEKTKKTARQYRWVWLTFAYGGAFAAALSQLPWYTVTLAWAVIGIAAVIIVSMRRLRRPTSLLQETAAHHALWSIFAASVAALVTRGLVGTYPDLIAAVGAAALAHGVSQATEYIKARNTSFSTREELAPLIVAGLFAGGCYLAALQGSQWSTAAVVAALFAATLFTAPLANQVRAALDRLPPRSAMQLDEAVKSAEAALTTNPDLEELIAALSSIATALPRGALALVSFEPNWTVVLSDNEIEQRAEGPGAPLRKMLTTPFHVRPLLAERVVDRSVRETDLRPAADLIDELHTKLIVPLPGGPEGSLAGALFVGLPSWGSIRGRTGASLDRLAQHLGPQLRAAVILEQAGGRIGALEQGSALNEDKLERIEYQLERLQEENRLLRADRAGTTPKEIVGRSKAMKGLLRDIEKAASIDASLLIRGETGTGRTLVARTIHESSPRREGPLVQFDCTGTSQSMHLKALAGRMDGAVARPGVIELAHQGSLLLEEVGALSLEAQAELVRILASGEVARSAEDDGAPALRSVDVRIIGSTGRTSEKALERDTLLPELYDRLKAIEVQVPPLRERRGDIPELTQFLLEKIAKKHGLDVRGLTQESLELLEGYSWPGNVRQLRAVIEHAALICRGKRIPPTDLPSLDATEPLAPVAADEETLLDGTFEEIERAVLQRSLQLAKGNKAEAARRLGLKRTTFTSRLRKLGL